MKLLRNDMPRIEAEDLREVGGRQGQSGDLNLFEIWRDHSGRDDDDYSCTVCICVFCHGMLVVIGSRNHCSIKAWCGPLCVETKFVD